MNKEIDYDVIFLNRFDRKAISIFSTLFLSAMCWIYSYSGVHQGKFLERKTIAENMRIDAIDLRAWGRYLQQVRGEEYRELTNRASTLEEYSNKLYLEK